MAHHITIAEAKEQLAELIEAVVDGESVFITGNRQQTVQLVAVTRANGRRVPGSAKGLIFMADDFDAPLADFDEYQR